MYHIDLPANDADEQRRQLCDDRNWLLDQGFEATSYAYPYSSYSQARRTVGRRPAASRARARGWELNIGPNCGQTCAESIPPRNRWAVRTFKPVDVETSVADLQDQVLNALNHGGGWVPIMFHDICSNCGFYAMATADLNAFLDWLATQPVEVRTVRDVMGVTTIAPPVQSPRAGAAQPRQPAAEPGHGDDRRGLGAAVPDPGALLAAGRRLVGRGGVGPGQHRCALRLLVDDDRPAVERPVGYHELVASPDLGGCAVPAAAAIASASRAGTAPRARSASCSRVRQGPWSWQSATIDATLPPAAGWTQFSSTCRRCRAAHGDGAGHPHPEPAPGHDLGLT